MPDAKKPTLRVPVEFGDTDPAATVFYPNFFRWFDAACWRLLFDAGPTLDALRTEFGLIGAPIVDARASFVKAVMFGDTMEITSSITDCKRKTFEVLHEVRSNGELCAEGSEIRCFITHTDDDDPGRYRAVRIPEEIRRRLTPGDGQETLSITSVAPLSEIRGEGHAVKCESRIRVRALHDLIQCSQRVDLLGESGSGEHTEGACQRATRATGGYAVVGDHVAPHVTIIRCRRALLRPDRILPHLA